MNLTTIRAELGAWFEAVTGIEGEWNGRPQGWVGPTPAETDLQAHGLLAIRGAVGQGEDSLTWTLDAGAALGLEMTPSQGGNREFTFEAQIHSFDASDGVDALNFAELLRDSVRLPAATSAFVAADIGLQSVLQVSPLSPAIRTTEWELSAAVIEIRFNAEASLEGNSIGYVETFEIYGESEGLDGSTMVIIDGDVPSP